MRTGCCPDAECRFATVGCRRADRRWRQDADPDEDHLDAANRRLAGRDVGHANHPAAHPVASSPRSGNRRSANRPGAGRPDEDPVADQESDPALDAGSVPRAYRPTASLQRACRQTRTPAEAYGMRAHSAEVSRLPERWVPAPMAYDSNRRLPAQGAEPMASPPGALQPYRQQPAGWSRWWSPRWLLSRWFEPTRPADLRSPPGQSLRMTSMEPTALPSWRRDGRPS